jgi:hypothetical protein
VLISGVLQLTRYVLPVIGTSQSSRNIMIYPHYGLAGEECLLALLPLLRFCTRRNDYIPA